MKRFSRPTYAHLKQLCESCQNYAGGCSWSEVGKDGKVKFVPVPGWDAVKVPYTGAGKKDFTYQISGCPLYLPDPPRKHGDGHFRQKPEQIKERTSGGG